MTPGGTVELIQLAQSQGDSVNYFTILFRIGLIPRIDIENCGGLHVMITTLINGGARKILADMSSLEFIDSAGIGVLINAAKLMKTKGGELAFTGVSADMKKLFKIVNLQGFIRIFNLDAEALNHFRYI